MKELIESSTRREDAQVSADARRKKDALKTGHKMSEYDKKLAGAGKVGGGGGGTKAQSTPRGR